MPWAEDPSLENTRKFVHTSVKNWEAKKGNNFAMVVIYKPTNEITGASGFGEDSIVEKGIYTTGYWLDITYKGKGLVTEFVNSLTQFAFSYLNAKAVQLYINKNSLKNIAVANRLGFMPPPITNQNSSREENDIDIFIHPG